MKNKNFDPLDYLIFEGIGGSHLYGTNTEDSDLDVRSVCIPPKNVILDPFHNFKVADSFEGEDKQVYDLGAFMKLCSDSNPNIIELLYIPDSKIIKSSPAWKMLVEKRHLFISKNVKHRFSGFLFSQLKSLIRHREWFTNPPSKKPERKDFGLSETPKISFAWLTTIKNTLNYDIIKPELVEEIRKEESYRESKKRWDNYVQWQTNRNPKRKASEERIGFDGKYALHMFRLREEGRQLLLNGNIEFPLRNAKWLLDIKNGKYSYEEILDMTKTIETDFETWYNESPLPHKPNVNALKELYFEMVREYSQWQ